MSDKLQFVDWYRQLLLSIEVRLSTAHDKLKEALIKYREAVTTSSPGLPSRLPWFPISTRLNPDGGDTPLPNVAAERQRWAGGRYRFAV